jgi:hypothetical protein
MKDGAHTHGPGGGGGLALVVIIAALAIGSGAVTAAVHVLEVAVIALGAVIGLAVLGGVALLVYRARSEGRRRLISAPVVSRIGSAPRPELSKTYKAGAPEIRNGITDLAPEIGNGIADLRAIEPPQIHVHIYVADPAEAAAIIRTALPGTAGGAITEEE